MTHVKDVEQALINARVLEEYWISNGWESLELEEETMTNEILDIYPYVEVDISVTITIKLASKIYTVPLEDVSFLSIDHCLVIQVEDLYPDWEERVSSKLGEIVKEELVIKEEVSWEKDTFLGNDGKLRIIWQKQ